MRCERGQREDDFYIDEQVGGVIGMLSPLTVNTSHNVPDCLTILCPHLTMFTDVNHPPPKKINRQCFLIF